MTPRSIWRQIGRECLVTLTSFALLVGPFGCEWDAQVMTDVTALVDPTIPEIVSATMRAFVKVYHRSPAFVMIWLRGRTNQAIRDYGRDHNRRVARDLFDYARGLGLLVEEARPAYAEIAVEIGDRLFQLAFETDLRGDGVVLAEAEKMVAGYLQQYAAKPA